MESNNPTQEWRIKVSKEITHQTKTDLNRQIFNQKLYQTDSLNKQMNSSQEKSNKPTNFSQERSKKLNTHLSETKTRSTDWTQIHLPERGQ